MKILMRNIGMTLHVIHKLRAQGIDERPGQHGLAAPDHERRVARRVRRHARRPRGCSATSTRTPAGARSTTTTWSARRRSWRRSSSRSSCAGPTTARTASASASTSTRTPRTRSTSCAAASCSGTSSTRWPGASTTPALREAQSRKDAIRAYELVYAALGAPDAELGDGERGRGRPRRRHDRRQGARGRARRGRSSRAPSVTTASRSRTPGLVRAGSRGLVERAARRRSPRSVDHEVAGIGLSGQMHGLVALDEHERVLRPAILWNDQRTAAECAEIEERVGLERLISLTGNRALTGFTAPKLLWLRTHEPEVYARIRHILLPKDYVRLRLCGERAIDVADASGTLLFDVAERRFSTRRAGRARGAGGVDAARARVARDLGPARPRASRWRRARATARPRRSASASSGPGPVSLVLGTSGVVFAALPAYQPDAQARVHVFCHAVPGSLARDGRDALGRRLAAVGARHVRAGRAVRAADGGGRGGARGRGRHPLPALPLGRAHAARRPGRARGLRRAEREPHPRPRHARRARGRRVRAGGLVRPPARARRARRRWRAPRAAARAATSGCASAPRCWACRSAACRWTRARRSAPRCSAASPAGSSPTSDEAVAACVRVRDQIDPEPAWLDLYAERRDALPRLYPALKGVLG